MKNRRSKYSGYINVLINRYFIASVLFLAWIIFFDENCFIDHSENKRRLRELNAQKSYYLERIADDKQKIEELNAGINELEKFARENYYLSKPDEDLYIVVEKE